MVQLQLQKHIHQVQMNRGTCPHFFSDTLLYKTQVTLLVYTAKDALDY
jgi:hypothetical protein